MCAPVSSLAGSLVVGRPHRLCFLPWSSRSTRGGSPPLCSCYVRLLEYTVSFGWRQRSQSSPALACRVRDTPLSRLPLRGPPPVTSRSFWLCPSLLLSSLCPPSECPGRGTARCHLSPPLAFAVQLPIWGVGQCGEEGLDSLLRFDAFRPLCCGGPIVLYCTCSL